MYDERMLKILELCRSIASVPEDIPEDNDTYAVGVVDSLDCILSSAIAEVKEDIEESRRLREKYQEEKEANTDDTV